MQLFHHYNRKGQPNIFRDRPEDWYHSQMKSNARAKWILQLGNSTKPADLDESELSYQYYGMGEARTLQQYWDFAGVHRPVIIELQLSGSSLHKHLRQSVMLKLSEAAQCCCMCCSCHCCPRYLSSCTCGIAAQSWCWVHVTKKLQLVPQPLPSSSVATLHLLGCCTMHLRMASVTHSSC